jgi:hypothetical protein
MGNCHRFNLKGHVELLDVVKIQGIYTLESVAFPVMISPSICQLCDNEPSTIAKAPRCIKIAQKHYRNSNL